MNRKCREKSLSLSLTDKTYLYAVGSLDDNSSSIFHIRLALSIVSFDDELVEDC